MVSYLRNILIVIGLLTAILPACAREQGALHWSQTNHAAQYLFRAHNLKSAEEAWLECLEMARRFGPKDPRIAESLDSLGMVCIESDQLGKAEDYLNKALEEKQSLYGRQSTELTSTAKQFEKLAEKYSKNGNYSKAEVYYETALSLEKEIPDKDIEPDLVRNYCYVLTVLGKSEEALELGQKYFPNRPFVIFIQNQSPRYKFVSYKNAPIGKMLEDLLSHEDLDVRLDETIKNKMISIQFRESTIPQAISKVCQSLCLDARILGENTVYIEPATNTYCNYLRMVQEKILDAWKKHNETRTRDRWDFSNERLEPNTCLCVSRQTIAFTIHSDGRISDDREVSLSEDDHRTPKYLHANSFPDNPNVDPMLVNPNRRHAVEAALEAIQNAAPYEKFPPGFPDTLNLQVRFDYYAFPQGLPTEEAVSRGPRNRLVPPPPPIVPDLDLLGTHYR
ncbi:MAG: tetratricopeptide repeat protein [Cyanobacteria bacterium HKST-UBA02]|nr:tetratricopeptide repeat protein [Cyanobacteria bacterium HKST-UBA02]